MSKPPAKPVVLIVIKKLYCMKIRKYDKIDYFTTNVDKAIIKW